MKITSDNVFIACSLGAILTVITRTTDNLSKG